MPAFLFPSHDPQGGGYHEHIAADKGNAPNTDTGFLANSVAVEFNRNAGIAYVGTSVDYGAYLEFDGWQWLEPALDKNRDKLFNDSARMASNVIGTLPDVVPEK